MATHADADLVLRLYDLRREEVLRRARAFFLGWNPATASEASDVAGNRARQENAYYRQVTSFWEMAFSIVNSGAVNADLFAKNCGEGIIVCLKCDHLRGKFPQAGIRTMPEAAAFIVANPIAKEKAEAAKSRFT